MSTTVGRRPKSGNRSPAKLFSPPARITTRHHQNDPPTAPKTLPPLPEAGKSPVPGSRRRHNSRRQNRRPPGSRSQDPGSSPGGHSKGSTVGHGKKAKVAAAQLRPRRSARHVLG